ncbi:hypothetical protein BC829DRAFT_421453 [Chytridium lagenaria]|nr:hypothetical protein BC829DRAFT_421453 [Chytridium lagenaria]
MCEVIFFVAWDTFRVTAALSILATSCVALVTFVVVQTVYRFVKPWIIYVFDLINNMTTSHPDPVTFEDAMPKSFEDSNDEYRRNPNDRFPESVSPAKHQNTQPQTYFKDNEDPATDTYTSDKNEYMDGELTSDARQPSNGHLQLNAIPPSSPSESHLPHIHHELPDIWTSDDTLFTPDERAQNGMETNKCIEQGGFVDAVRGFFDGFASFFSKKQ